MGATEKEQRRTQARRLAMMVKVVFRLASVYGLDVRRTAEEFGVCTRTIRRYLNAAKAAGVPVEYDPLVGVHFARRGWKPGDLALPGELPEDYEELEE